MVKTPLARIALSFLKAFMAGFTVASLGIWKSPDMSAAKAAAVAAIFAGLDAGLKAVQIALESRNTVVP